MALAETGSGRPGLVLGSASPRRLDLLAQIGIKPAALRPADIDETPLKAELPRDYVMRMALEKANAIEADADEAVLTADTTVSVGRRILGKPQDRGEAAEFMRLMSGRRHKVLTSVALSYRGKVRSRLVETTVRMRNVTEAELAAYLDVGDWHGKAGAYAIQGAAAVFIPWIQGSFSAVVGLPLAETASLLASIGIVANTEGDRP